MLRHTPKQDETDRVLVLFGLSDDLFVMHAADMADLLERFAGAQRRLGRKAGLVLAETFIHFDDAVRENIDNAVLEKVI